MNKLMRLVVAGLCLVAGMVFGAEYTLKPGTTDWTKPDSYEPAGIPGADDTVALPEETFEIDSSSVSFATLSGIGRLVPEAKTKLVITVGEGEATLGCAFNKGGETSGGATTGELVKRGQGTLKLGSFGRVTDTLGYPSDYCTRLTLEEGRLSLLQEPKDFPSTSRTRYGLIVTSNGTELVASVHPNRENSVWSAIEWMSIGGVVTNEHATQQRIINLTGRTDIGDSRVDGAVGGKIRFWTSGNIDFRGTASTFSGNVTATGWREDPKFASGLISVAKFGMKTDSASAIGSASAMVTHTYGSGFRYTGSEPDVTDKSITSYANVFLDGGEYGGMEFRGPVGNYSDSASNEGQHRFVLYGTNASAPCTFSGTMSGDPGYTTKVSGEDYYSFYVVKRGTGTWRFTGNKKGANVGWNGGLAVEEGTFQFDSIAPAGSDCSLGTALKLTDGTAGVWSPEHMVDYAIALGSASPAAPAVFEYIGSTPAACATRPLVLVDAGGAIRADGGSLDFSGVSARDAGSSTTLTLTGTNKGENVVREVFAGAENATIGVTKEGTGTWTVGGNFKVNGDVKVKEGTLSIDVPRKLLPPAYTDYKWFRLSIAEIADGKGNKSNSLYLRQIALFDKDGVRQNVGLTVPDSTYDSENNIVLATTVAKGQAAYDPSMAGKSLGAGGATGNLATCFNGQYASYTPYTLLSLSTTPVASNPSSWIKIVMRLPDSANPITHFDVQGYQASCMYVPQRLKMEASADGRNWTEVYSNLKDETPHSFTTEGYNPWISDGVKGAADNRPLGTGFTLAASGAVVEQEEPFSWFRLSIAELEGKGSQLNIRQIALYDKVGNRQNIGLKLAGGVVPEAETVRTLVATEIGPGEVGYDPSVSGYKVNAKKHPDAAAGSDIDLPAAFNEVYSGTGGRYWIDWKDKNGADLKPTPSSPDTWIPIVMHLPDWAATVTHFDIQAFSYQGSARAFPSRLKFEGSTDGKTWFEVWSNLKEGDPAIGPTMTSYNKWTSDGSDAPGTRPEGTGFTLSTSYPQQLTYDQELAGGVQVARGATLAATNPMELDALTIDADDAGTLSGFALAETGTLNVLNPKKDGSFLPGTFENCTGIENLVNWSVRIDGAAKPAYRIEVTADGKVRLIPPGTLLIVR